MEVLEDEKKNKKTRAQTMVNQNLNQAIKSTAGGESRSKNYSTHD